MDSFMNPQRNNQGLRPDEKAQNWGFIECKWASSCPADMTKF